MELVRAKIKKTGETVVMEKVLKNEETAYFSTGRMFGADEVEILEDPLKSQRQPDPLEQLPQEMMQMVTGVVNDFIDRSDAMYWQRQRVEITKVLINKLDLVTQDPIAICNLADQYIRMLKNYK